MQNKQSSNFIYQTISRLMPRSRAEAQGNSDDPNDRSYEDALLDVEITSYFRTEYGDKEPPTGVFPRIIQALRLHREMQEKRADTGVITRLGESLGQKLASAYRFGARADSGRVLSGGLVTALLLVAVWPSMSRTLADNNNSLTIHGAYFEGFSHSGSITPDQYPTSTANPYGAFQGADTAQPTSISGNAEQAVSTGGQYMSPGRLYEEPLMQLEARTGEVLTQADSKTNPPRTQPNQSNTDKISGDPDQEQYQRPVTGQD